MPKYVRKPLVVDAIFFEGGSIDAERIVDWVLDRNAFAKWHDIPYRFSGFDRGPVIFENFVEVRSLKGAVILGPNRWLVEVSEGLFESWTHDDFNNTFTIKVDQTNP